MRKFKNMEAVFIPSLDMSGRVVSYNEKDSTYEVLLMEETRVVQLKEDQIETYDY